MCWPLEQFSTCLDIAWTFFQHNHLYFSGWIWIWVEYFPHVLFSSRTYGSKNLKSSHFEPLSIRIWNMIRKLKSRYKKGIQLTLKAMKRTCIIIFTFQFICSLLCWNETVKIKSNKLKEEKHQTQYHIQWWIQLISI